MTRPEKASEPSMEEILASIRKIIAEEPIGSRPGPALPGLPDGTRSARSGSDAREHGEPAMLPFPEHDSAGGESPYSVEDALADLIEDGSSRGDKAVKREPEPGFAARPGRPETDDSPRPGWLFAKSAASPASPDASAGTPARPGNGPVNPLDMLRQAPRTETAPRESTGLGAAIPKPFSDLPLPGLPKLDGLSARPGDAAGLPKPASSRTGEDEASAAQPSPVVGAPKDASGLNGLGARNPALNTPARPAETGPAKLAPAEESPQKSTQPAVGRDGSAAPSIVKAPTIAAESAPKPAVSEPARRPELSALDALAQGLTGAKPVTKPAMAPASAPAPAPASGESKAASPEPVAAAIGKTLEDTVADLLRPMLRDWLDANMPRIVEKALRVELAANAQRSGKSEQN